MQSDRQLSLKRLPSILALVGLAGASLLLAGNAPVQPAGDPPKAVPEGKPQPAPQPVDGGTRQPGRVPGGPGGERGGGLGGAMKQIGGAYKALKTNIDKADQKDQNLMLVATMQRGCLSAKSSKPTNLKGDPKDLAKTQEEFQRAQIKLMGMLLELETQILDGKTAEAKATLEKLHDLEETSHEKFEQKKPREPRGNSPKPEDKSEKK